MMPLSSLALSFAFLQDAADPSALPVNPAPIAAHGSAIGEILHNSGPVAIAVLVLLAVLSIFSWTVIISKYRAFAAAKTQSVRFIRAFRKSGRNNRRSRNGRRRSSWTACSRRCR